MDSRLANYPRVSNLISHSKARGISLRERLPDMRSFTEPTWISPSFQTLILR